MKNHTQTVAVLLAGAMLLTLASCAEKWKTTESGLHYKFQTTHPDAQKVQEGDVLVGEMTVRIDTTEIFSNRGHADRILGATPSFRGDLYEGLLMMHIGDAATFYFPADTLAEFLQEGQMPPQYKPGTGMNIYYEISLQDIVTHDELLIEENNYRAEMDSLRANEPQAIASYVRDNGIKAKPNADGLYIIVKKAGNGPKVETGREVALNYTGRLLDGTIFDSSVESDAIQGGIQQPGRPYEPLTYTVGKMSLIPGWEQGVMGQPAGTRLQLLIPSALAYGPRGAGNAIPPYSPLLFDIEIVSVK
ncbi:MAG: FKBP-type peptidyl-prolyl cis-trans isomerase [Bacteroidales bacterium]|nr:FKBP-type peptidyl-prolyl cis-trans isomerase [Bacteroidales bacterium]